MELQFTRTLKKLRTEKGLSQQEMADLLYVTRSTIARWENGSRLPDAVMIPRLAQCLGVDISTFLSTTEENDEPPIVIMLDDNKIVLTGSLPVLETVLPNATIIGFTRPCEAIEFAKENRIALAFLDIELGKLSGLDLCRTLLEINPHTNVVFLTAYSGYSLDAWSTGASGFMLKPITPAGVQEQLKNLRYPLVAGGASW